MNQTRRTNRSTPKAPEPLNDHFPNHLAPAPRPPLPCHPRRRPVGRIRGHPARALLGGGYLGAGRSLSEQSAASIPVYEAIRVLRPGGRNVDGAAAADGGAVAD